MGRKRIHKDPVQDILAGTYTPGSKEEPKKKGTPLHVIGYVRVSSNGQVKDGHGLDSQQMVCKREAQNMGTRIIKFFKDEGVSGREIKRKGLDSMIEYIKQNRGTKHPVTHVTMSENSRLGRTEDFLETMQLQRDIERLGVKFVYANNPALNTTDEKDNIKTIMNMLAHHQASEESKHISDRTVRGMSGRLLNGYYPFPRPIGYKSGERVSPTTGKIEKIMLVNEGIAPHLTEGLELFASGELQSQAQLLRFLQQRGLEIKNQSSLEKILAPKRLILYAGYVTHPNFEIYDLIKAQHEAIISLETAKAIRRRIDGVENKPVKVRKDFNDKFPLRGLIYCSECGKKLSGAPSRSHTGRYYNYYQCVTRTCPQRGKTISANIVHETVKEDMSNRQNETGTEDFSKFLFEEVLDRNLENYKTAKKMREKEIQRIEDSISKTVNKIVDISHEGTIQKLEERLEELEQMKANLEQQQENEAEIFNKDELYELAQQILAEPTEIWEHSDPELKQIFLGVRYNGKIFYKKGLGVLNPETSLVNWIYTILRSINLPNHGVRELNS